MRRDQLEHAIRTACQIIGRPEVIVVKVQNANTAAPDGEPLYAGWCLDKEDLCVAKLCAFRERPELRRGTRALRARRPQDHPHPAQRRRRALPPSGRGGRLLAPLAVNG
jgi:hypothetical protein